VDLKFIDRVIKTTLVFAALIFPFLAVYMRMNFALAVLFGAIWGALNLLGIKIIITRLLVPEKADWAVGLAVIFLKLPVLYFIGYLLVTWEYMSVPGLLWGFSGILIVAVLKVASRAILGLDDKKSAGPHNLPLEKQA
jgi:hypothetical protein